MPLIDLLVGLFIVAFFFLAFSRVARIVQRVSKMAGNPEAIGKMLRRELEARAAKADAPAEEKPTVHGSAPRERDEPPRRSTHGPQEISSTPGFIVLLLLAAGAAAYFWFVRG